MLFCLILSLLSLTLSGAPPPPVCPPLTPTCTDFQELFPGPQYPVPLFQRQWTAAIDTTAIADDLDENIDFGHARLLAKGYISQCQLDRHINQSLAYFCAQIGLCSWTAFPEVPGAFSLDGSDDTIIAYPYANVAGWVPTITSDTAFQHRNNGMYSWWDGGLLIYFEIGGTFPGGVLVGVNYTAPSLFWHDFLTIERNNYTTPWGQHIPACLAEPFISRSTIPSPIVFSAQGTSQNYLYAQVVTADGQIGFYNDFLMSGIFGTEGIWNGVGTQWETSRLTVTFQNYVRPC